MKRQITKNSMVINVSNTMYKNMSMSFNKVNEDSEVDVGCNVCQLICSYNKGAFFADMCMMSIM